jgi:tryptophanase
VDLHSECERLHNVLYEAETSLQNLNSVLYNQINKYGSAYLDQMKQIDAGLYTVSDIDDQIDRLHQQTNYLVELLQKDIQPNDLVKDFAP